MVECSSTTLKTFLVCCNAALLFVGLSVVILGVKMEWAMSVLLLIHIPIVLKTIKAVIATGVFISASGVTGIWGACYESTWVLFVHMVSLGIIVIMEFSLGVTLMIVKRTVEKSMGSSECNNMCVAAVDAIILDYALPSAGLMMTIIFVEALMLYSSIKLFFHFRDFPKTIATPADASQQSVQMQNVAAPHLSFIPGPVSVYTPQMMFMTTQPELSYAPPPFSPHGLFQGMNQAAQETKPPDYNSLYHVPYDYQPLTRRRPSFCQESLTQNSGEDSNATVPKEPERNSCLV